jgi:catechol 2,3-dioxygenase-like lactoylglutathione lyase family enzyme
MLNAKKTVRVGHICLEVADIAAAKRFYAPLLNELGFKVILEENDSAGWRNESFAMFLAKPEDRRVSKKTPREDDFAIADHVAFLLDDRDEVDAIAAFMKKCGFHALFPPEENPEFVPGYYSVSYTDPDNNVLELYCTG